MEMRARMCRRLRCGALVSGLAASLALTTACAPSPTPAVPAQGAAASVTIDQGALNGVDLGQVHTFRNIPYAAPPVGPLRWRPPQAAPSWQSARDASTFGADCIQNRPFWDDSQSRQTVSEDCLTLNVWRPERAEDAPVMVWIHGGGYMMGSASQPVFDGEALAARGVVVVTLNYRLGRFGFFAHPALSAQHPDEAQGNYGFMDQVAALRWVRDNIQAFGGDPDQVTVFGESAGGGSVLQLMLSRQARGLFQRAIVQSGGGRDNWPSLIQAQAVGQAFAEHNSVATANQLRALSADALKGRLDILTPEKDTYSGPMIDGQVMTSNPVQGFSAGRQARVPLLIGATDNELGSIPAPFRSRLANETLNEAGLQRNVVEPLYGDAFGTRMAGELNFVEPARALARLASDGQPVWLYSFAYVAEAKRGEWDGAPHASELGYVFDTLGALSGTYSPADHLAADRVADAWVAFAKGQTPAWPAYSPNIDQLGRFDALGLTTINQPDASRLDALGALRSAR